MLKLELFTDASAFDDEQRGAEIARILRALADQIAERDGCGSWSLRDINGNRCGTAHLTAAGED